MPVNHLRLPNVDRFWGLADRLFKFNTWILNAMFITNLDCKCMQGGTTSIVFCSQLSKQALHVLSLRLFSRFRTLFVFVGGAKGGGRGGGNFNDQQARSAASQFPCKHAWKEAVTISLPYQKRQTRPFWAGGNKSTNCCTQLLRTWCRGTSMLRSGITKGRV